MQPPIETLSPPGILCNDQLYFLILSRISFILNPGEITSIPFFYQIKIFFHIVLD